MKLELIDKHQEIDNIFTFTFKPDSPITWQAGQFLHYRFSHPNPDERGIERWFTIAAAPYEQKIKITTKFADGLRSSFKQALNDMKIGDKIQTDKPEGDFVVDDLTNKYIFIAGGIGITPFYAILKQLDHENKIINADLLYLSRDTNLAFIDELEAIHQNNHALCIHKYIGDQKISDDELAAIAELEDVIYISGPKSMVGYYFEKLQQLGVQLDRLKKDFFPGYQNY